MTCKISVSLLIVVLWFTSCMTTLNMSSIQVEIMKPALFTMPEDIDTIAIFKRNQFRTDTTTFRYFNRYKQKTDTAIHYRQLSNSCVDALADYLNNDGYFIKIINYRDSLHHMFSAEDSLINHNELHEKLGVDAIVFLDMFLLDDHQVRHNDLWDMGLAGNFDDFAESSKMEYINATLLWTVSFRGDTLSYMYKQTDNLYYGNSVYPQFFGNDINHKQMLVNTSVYLGKTFGAKIVPSWHTTERAYYRSNNVNMIQAEKYCLNGDWLKAAELFNKETKNKNRNLAAQAKYNMALVCEMEGKPDAAIDWLVLAYYAHLPGNENHKFNCQRYINLLAMRKREIERLGKQVREKPISF